MSFFGPRAASPCPSLVLVLPPHVLLVMMNSRSPTRLSEPSIRALVHSHSLPRRRRDGLGGSLARLHGQLRATAAYYRAQLLGFEVDLGGVRDYADADTQDALWCRAVVRRGGGDFDTAAGVVEARLRGVCDTHAALVAASRYGRGDLFALTRAESLMSMLAARGTEISRLVVEARDHCLACQQLVDELELTMVIANPDADKVRAIIDSSEESRQ